MTYYVVTRGEHEDYEIVGVTGDKDWVERYCAIHEDCRMEKYKAGAGLAMSQRELMIPLNTEVIVKWDIATESAYIWDHSRTTHKPTDWTVDGDSSYLDDYGGSIYLRKIFFGKIVTDIDRNCELICMSTKDLFQSTLTKMRELQKKERADDIKQIVKEETSIVLEINIIHNV